ncbi:nuclease-related domain-containing protein [Metasolibacillus fluoroglycofenilyticus]|uniref:nuclease-related domain-containing protein n=1 Tax=Metasolibacillus fluoroglycofenilyticus TaxID=1239396 RepID=UPI000D3BF716|nr:nuclease-related domain-containing protein [Metasolibacillus fluoroglycofenilyticus]
MLENQKEGEWIIALQREKALKELVLQAAVRRGFHKFKDELIRLQQGLSGERYVDRCWQDMQLEEQHYLLHDFQTNAHQIDSIFLCDKFILLVEIKNIAGRVDFDEARYQFTRKLEDGTVHGFRNPLDQVRRHQRMLRAVVRNLPVLYAIVFSHPKTIIGHIPKGEPIFHCSGLEFHIRKLLAQHNTAQLTSTELLTTKLMQMHTIKKPQLQIEQTKIRTGVLCVQCQAYVQMHYHYGVVRKVHFVLSPH